VKIRSPFKLGIGIFIIGIGWVGFLFYQGVNESNVESLNFKESEEFMFKLEGEGIGFYKITIHDFDHDTSIFTQIRDPLGNVIADQKIDTRMAVNYFDYAMNGDYIIKITSLSDRTMGITLEYGDTNSSDLFVPGIIAAAGAFVMIYATAMRMKDHSIAQP